MITISQCLDFTDLSPNEMILGPALSPRHNTLLAGYLCNLDRGALAVRDMIIADLRMFLDFGAPQRAADMLVVLRLFLFQHPQILYAASNTPVDAVSLFDKTSRGDEREVLPNSDKDPIPPETSVDADAEMVIVPFCRYNQAKTTSDEAPT